MQTKIKFHISDYLVEKSDKVAMHCNSKEEAREFLDHLNSIGRTWRNGASYIGRDNYSDYGNGTCYFFLEGTYGYYDTSVENDVKVLEFSDFDFDFELEIDKSDSDLINDFLRLYAK